MVDNGKLLNLVGVQPDAAKGLLDVTVKLLEHMSRRVLDPGPVGRFQLAEMFTYQVVSGVAALFTSATWSQCGSCCSFVEPQPRRGGGRGGDAQAGQRVRPGAGAAPQ